MTTYLFFDVETTGLPKNYNLSPVQHPDNWPHIVEMAWALCESNGNIITQQSHLITPELYKELPSIITDITGITKDELIFKGTPLRSVLDKFLTDLDKATYTVAHNISFDVQVTIAELIRLKDIQYKKLISTPRICTMQLGTDLCKIPKGNMGYKWPKLSELYQFLFNEVFKDAHRALPDVLAEIKCFFEMIERGVKVQ